MKLKDIKGLLPEDCHLDWYGFEAVSEKELEIDVERVEKIIVEMTLGKAWNSKWVADAIAKEFPVKCILK